MVAWKAICIIPLCPFAQLQLHRTRDNDPVHADLSDSVANPALSGAWNRSDMASVLSVLYALCSKFRLADAPATVQMLGVPQPAWVLPDVSTDALLHPSFLVHVVCASERIKASPCVSTEWAVLWNRLVTDHACVMCVCVCVCVCVC